MLIGDVSAHDPVAEGTVTQGQSIRGRLGTGESLLFEPVRKTSQEQVPEKPRIRNLILLIGDGMGPQQVGLLTQYAHHGKHSPYEDRQAAIERLMNEGVAGIMRTEPHNMLVVDSAASATQIATGQYAGSEMIGANYQGDSAKTVLEYAKESGRSTGLVSDTRITHATPASFAAHQRHRSMENEIAGDMLETQPDVMLSGGLRHWVPAAAAKKESVTYEALRQLIGDAYPITTKRTDNRNLLLEARDYYQLAFDRYALARIEEMPVLGLFSDTAMLDALAEKAADNAGTRNQPTLVEMSKKAIELLDQNPAGFFLMIEGGQIDWTGHNNDAGAMLHELLRFDAVVAAVMEWAKDRDDTVIVVTADHETGSFGFSYSGSSIPKARQLAGNVFNNEKFEPNFNFARQRTLESLYGQKQSYYTILETFDALPAKEQTAESLMELVNSAMPLNIDLDEAVQVLTRSRNKMYQEGHPFLGTKTLPNIRDFNSFYVYGENLRMNLLGRLLAEEQNVVWGTGTHTSTPVTLGAWGPEAATKPFSGIHHSTDIGQRMIELMQQ
ncbi:Alkaline phosphatase 4 precursor [Adhaeretor mobilis]|uniref:Alkaline phosphatase 4 n=2 Tax=Adhaeretor mobilis TaxID=1930276 RepID=A0A517MRY2_9BACT|nr:Alkaline phosphatase 4 precursor [Adhaeretor mobilis]